VSQPSIDYLLKHHHRCNNVQSITYLALLEASSRSTLTATNTGESPEPGKRKLVEETNGAEVCEEQNKIKSTAIICNNLTNAYLVCFILSLTQKNT